MTFYDVHSHVLNWEHVPENFIGLQIPLSDRFLNWAAGKLSWLIPGANDRLENVASFLDQLSKTIEQNYLDLAKNLPEDHCVCIQTLDLNPVMGEEKIPYPVQLHEVLKLKEKYGGRIKIFMHLVPNSSYYDALIEVYLNKPKRSIDGIKLYPSLDSKLDNKNFRKMFAICEDLGVSITVHCGESGIAAPTFLNWGNQKNAHPKYWEEVLSIYPKLKVNLAHFGSGDAKWEEYIIRLMKEYPGVYTDTANSCGDEKRMQSYAKWLVKEPILRERLLFGIDFYMVYLLDRNIGSSIERVKRYIGDEMFRQISETNPMKFF